MVEVEMSFNGGDGKGLRWWLWQRRMERFCGGYL